MGIHHDTVIMEDVSPDHIGGLSSHTGQSCQFFDLSGHLPTVFFPQGMGTGDDVFGLVMVKAHGMNDVFHGF